jgi:uncharacterized FlaG/YvyC family protein
MSDSDKRIKFDPTINFGHVLTFVGFIATGGMAWMTMNTRVVVLEEARQAQVKVDARQDMAIEGNQKAVREDLREISNKLDRLVERSK